VSDVPEPGATPDGGFQALILRDEGTVTLVLRGELDLAATVAAEAAVDQVLREPADHYVLELADLTFLDARGVRPLVRLAKLLDDLRAVKLQGRHASDRVALVFSLTPITLEGTPSSLSS
jgi:anti-anti-sigma factor